MGSQRVGHDLVTEQVPSTDLPNLGLYQIILCTLLLPKKKNVLELKRVCVAVATIMS